MKRKNISSLVFGLALLALAILFSPETLVLGLIIAGEVIKDITGVR